MSIPKNSAAFCEAAIQRQKDYCLEKNIYPRWPGIADTLIERRPELLDAYDDLACALKGDHRAADVFVDALLCTVCVWDPTSTQEMREAKARLAEVNQKIADLANGLSNFLQERSDLENSHSFGSNTHHHVVDVVIRAARGNYSFKWNVEPELNALTSRFDLKYWPDLSEIVGEIAVDAQNAEIEINNCITAAALASSRSSKADFCRALFERVREEARSASPLMPRDFHLKDDTWAAFINCLLDLPPEDMVDGPYIKRQRQRTRELAER
ncbi:hypothetical protein KBY25_20710 [Ruegeria pomeroyi]|nr:hypothetical protein [Ruegeria pomeroyi]